MAKPIIGVMPQYDLQADRIQIVPDYFKMILRTGGIPILLPMVQSVEDGRVLVEGCDGFLFTGGQDVNPRLYEEDLCACTDEIFPERDAFEQMMYHLVLKAGKPVLAICRGMQLINIACGGRLFQDVRIQSREERPLWHDQRKRPEAPAHSVRVQEGGLLHGIVGEKELMVNSMHHQGIQRLGRGLTSQAIARDSLIEAFSVDALDFGLGVQWHPEMLGYGDGASRKIFEAFINASHI